jgi:hypothetical protein
MSLCPSLTTILFTEVGPGFSPENVFEDLSWRLGAGVVIVTKYSMQKPAFFV